MYLHVTAILAALIFSGCGVGGSFSESNATLTLRVSAVAYVGDNNETNATHCHIGDINGSNFDDAEKTDRNDYGEWQFYEENLTGVRVISDGMFLDDVNCSDFNIEMNATAPTMKAPADGSSAFPYININPFTTLMVDANESKESLAARYPVSASVDADFNFDTYSVQYEKKYYEQNISEELCQVLYELLVDQNMTDIIVVEDVNSSEDDNASEDANATS